MKKISLIVITILLLTILITGTPDSGSTHVKILPENMAILSMPYSPGTSITPDFSQLEIAPSNNTGILQADFSVSDFLPSTEFQKKWPNQREMYTVYWSFQLPEESGLNKIGLFVGPARYPMDIYLNGVLVAQFGNYDDPDNLNISKYSSDNIHLPADLLNYEDEANIITIQIFPNYHYSPLPDLYISNYSGIEDTVFWRSFLNYHFVQTAIVLAIFTGCFFYFFYFITPQKHKQHILYALLCTFFALAYVNMAFDHNTSNEIILEKISRIGFPLLVTVMTLFFVEYLDLLTKYRKHLLLLFIPCIISGIITIVQPDYAAIQRYFSYTRNFYISPIMAGNMILLSVAYYRLRRKDVLVLMITMAFCLLVAMYDNYFLGRDTQPTFWIIPYGFFALTMVIFVFLALQLTNLMNELISKETNLIHSRNEIETRKKIETDLKHALKKADAASIAKSTFLANMSHEIRTPLNGIVGFAEIIHKSGKEPAVKEYSNLILNESEHLLELINNVLDISRIESNRIIIVSKTFNLKHSLELLKQTYSSRLDFCPVDFVFNYDPLLPDMVFGDKLRLNQALKNLLDNAVKFTQKGKIILTVSLCNDIPTKPGIDSISFSVEDTGIGISAQDQENIFDRFQQADISSTRRYGGSGLGLTISRDLVHLMGGTLKMDSTIDVGSRFYFMLPFAKASREDISEVQTTSVTDDVCWEHGSPKVLVIEDNLTNRKVVSIHLKDCGCEIMDAPNGEDGVLLFQKYHPDIILMDIQMPIMNGYDATKAIRKIPSGKKVPIIGLTANAFTHDKAQCLESGMNEVLTKPLRKNDLKNVLKRHLPHLNPRINHSTELPDREQHLHTEEVIDLMSLQQELDISEQELTDLLRGFLRDCESNIRSMESAISNSDIESLHRAAHTIKGGARNMAAPLIARQSLIIEQITKNFDRQNLSLLAPEVEILKSYINRLQKIMKDQLPILKHH